MLYLQWFRRWGTDLWWGSSGAGTEHQWMPIGHLDPAGTQFFPQNPFRGCSSKAFLTVQRLLFFFFSLPFYGSMKHLEDKSSSPLQIMRMMHRSQL